MPGLFQEFRKESPDALDEAVVNRTGYLLLGMNKNKEAIAVLKLNTDAYPDSANVYDSLAEAYMKNGDKELAIATYKKALEAIPKDMKADKVFLENLKRGALQKLSELEKK